MQILTNEQVIDNVITLVRQWDNTCIQDHGKIGPLRLHNKTEIEAQLMPRLAANFPALTFKAVSDFDITESVILDGGEGPEHILLIHFERKQPGVMRDPGGFRNNLTQAAFRDFSEWVTKNPDKNCCHLGPITFPDEIPTTAAAAGAAMVDKLRSHYPEFHYEIHVGTAVCPEYAMRDILKIIITRR